MSLSTQGQGEWEGTNKIFDKKLTKTFLKLMEIFIVLETPRYKKASKPCAQEIRRQ